MWPCCTFAWTCSVPCSQTPETFKVFLIKLSVTFHLCRKLNVASIGATKRSKTVCILYAGVLPQDALKAFGTYGVKQVFRLSNFFAWIGISSRSRLESEQVYGSMLSDKNEDIQKGLQAAAVCLQENSNSEPVPSSSVALSSHVLLFLPSFNSFSSTHFSVLVSTQKGFVAATQPLSLCGLWASRETHNWLMKWGGGAGWNSKLILSSVFWLMRTFSPICVGLFCSVFFFFLFWVQWLPV